MNEAFIVMEEIAADLEAGVRTLKVTGRLASREGVNALWKLGSHLYESSQIELSITTLDECVGLLKELGLTTYEDSDLGCVAESVWPRC
jgi:hypothetical protein